MTYILSAQRGSAQELSENFARYHDFLAEARSRLPPSVYELATSEWYYDARDHRCPHDGWLEELAIAEFGRGERNELRAASIRTRLLAAYHDGYIEYSYREVHSYDLRVPRSAQGNSDWLYDEFRLSERGLVHHEIEWAAGGRWLIEATDVSFTWHPFADRA